MSVRASRVLSTHPAPTQRPPRCQQRWHAGSSEVGCARVLGVGLVAFIDETVFHQLLHWHHFYDLGTPELGLVSDGVFHALSWAATVGGLFLFADLRRRRAFWATRWWGGVLLGAGFFQLYDGTVQHKLWGIHQIRYVPDTLPYDLTWNILAGVLVAVGAVLTLSTRRRRVHARE